MTNLDPIAVGRVFGEVLKRRRAALKISQEELAFLAGVDRTFISRLERGARQPTITTLFALSQALGAPVGELVDEAYKEFCLRSSS